MLRQILTLLVVVLAVLLPGVAQAQDDFRIYIPFVEAERPRDRDWFVLSELEYAMRQYNLPPEEYADNTVCNLADNMPQDQLRFSYCDTYPNEEQGDLTLVVTFVYSRELGYVIAMAIGSTP